MQRHCGLPLHPVLRVAASRWCSGCWRTAHFTVVFRLMSEICLWFLYLPQLDILFFLSLLSFLCVLMRCVYCCKWEMDGWSLRQLTWLKTTDLVNLTTCCVRQGRHKGKTWKTEKRPKWENQIADILIIDTCFHFILEQQYYRICDFSQLSEIFCMDFRCIK